MEEIKLERDVQGLEGRRRRRPETVRLRRIKGERHVPELDEDRSRKWE